MNTSSDAHPPTRLAILGTLADSHRQPLVYDLDCLGALVADLEPDLLCAGVTPAALEVGDLPAATIEVQEVLNLAENVLLVCQRDPGRRVLVAVQCQRLHRLVPLLKAHSDELEIVQYQKL